MQTIEIDFDVYKELTIRRKNENETYNDVLRKVLNLTNLKKSLETKKDSTKNAWIVKGVKFPEGTDFRALYKGITYTGKVVESHLYVNGKYYNSPSSAACAITGNSVNGWGFWEVRFPNQLSWKKMNLFKSID